MTCLIESTNRNSGSVIPFFPVGGFRSDAASNKISAKNQTQLAGRSANRMAIRAEVFIWFEVSMVPEVESVVVEREESGKQFSVVTIVNDNDPDIRRKIYAREKAIIDAHPGLYFDFHVRPRLNRPLTDLVGNGASADTVTFKR
jgi:hypothetical protein